MKNKLRAFGLGTRLCATAALLALLGACGSSIPDTDRVFLSAAGNWDLNHDGVVTRDEWKQYAGELFDAADTNHDGFVDRTEYVTIVSTDRMFQTVEFSYYDANGDGKLSREEFVSKPNRAFVLLDKGNTCRLDASQVAGARALTPSRCSIARSPSPAIRVRRAAPAPIRAA